MATRTQLHIGLFVSGLAGGGAQRRTLVLAGGMARRGIRVDLIAADAVGPFGRDLPEGVRLVDLGNRWRRFGFLRRRRGLWVPLSLGPLAAYLRRERPDVLLASSSPANLTAIAARVLAGTATSLAIVQNVHAGEAARHRRLGGLLRWLQRALYPKADVVIANAGAVADSLVFSLKLDRRRIVAIANPIDVKAIERRAAMAVTMPWSDGAPIILGVGKLKAQKDFATSIRAFKLLRATRPAHLVILGEGEQRAELLALARELGVENDVALPGFVANAEAWMARAAMLVSSSAWEGFSNVLGEALACGCPIVATDCPGGTREILDDDARGGTCGALVPVGDARAMAEAMHRTLDAPPAASVLRRRAADFGVDRAVERYLEVLRGIAAPAPAPTPSAFKPRPRDAAFVPVVEHDVDDGTRRALAAAFKPKRIAVFIYALTGGGAQRRSLTLANAFAACGHQVDLVVVRTVGVLNADLSPEVRLIGLDRGWGKLHVALSRTFRRRRIETMASIPALARYLRQAQPDVLLSAANHVNITAVAAWRLAGLPLALVLRASNHPSGNLKVLPLLQRPVHAYRRWLARRLYPIADAVVAVSQGVADDVVRLTGMDPARVVTVYNPVLTPSLRRRMAEPLDHAWLRPGTAPVILGAGRFVPQKDFATLIRAFKLLRAERPARLVILGEGPQRRRAQQLVEELGLGEDVLLPGYAPNALAWMRRAAVFALCSRWEGLPGVLIEALACGCPVVSTDCPSGPREILEDGRLGPLVPVGDAPALARALGAVLDAPPEREALMARARDFAPEAAIKGYLDVIETCIRRRARERLAWRAPWPIRVALGGSSEIELDALLGRFGMDRGDLFQNFRGNAPHRRRMAQMMDRLGVDRRRAVEERWPALKAADGECVRCEALSRCRHWLGTGGNDDPDAFCPNAELFRSLTAKAAE